MTTEIQTPEGTVTARVVRTGVQAGSWQYQTPYGYGIRLDEMARCLSGTVTGKIAETRSRKRPHGPACGRESVDAAAREAVEGALRKLAADPAALGGRIYAEVLGAARRANVKIATARA